MGWASNWTNIRVHFAHPHAWYKIVILEEGNQPYPWCPKCDKFVLHKALNGWRLATEFCLRREERKRRRLVEEEERPGTDMKITAYGIPISLVTYFKYLRRFLLAADNNWIEVVHNLRRARHKWARMSRVPIREGADART